jgi:hypothetical protein
MTLEELRKRILDEAKLNVQKTPDEIADILDSIISDYDLDEEQYKYILKDLFALEEQTNTKTLINASKAAKILLLRKNK